MEFSVTHLQIQCNTAKPKFFDKPFGVTRFANEGKIILKQLGIIFVERICNVEEKR